MKWREFIAALGGAAGGGTDAWGNWNSRRHDCCSPKKTNDANRFSGFRKISLGAEPNRVLCVSANVGG